MEEGGKEQLQVVVAFYQALAIGDGPMIKSLMASEALDWWFHGPPSERHLMPSLAGSEPLSSLPFKPTHIALLGSNLVCVEGHYATLPHHPHHPIKQESPTQHLSNLLRPHDKEKGTIKEDSFQFSHSHAQEDHIFPFSKAKTSSPHDDIVEEDSMDTSPSLHAVKLAQYKKACSSAKLEKVLPSHNFKEDFSEYSLSHHVIKPAKYKRACSFPMRNSPSHHAIKPNDLKKACSFSKEKVILNDSINNNASFHAIKIEHYKKTYSFVKEKVFPSHVFTNDSIESSPSSHHVMKLDKYKKTWSFPARNSPFHNIIKPSGYKKACSFFKEKVFPSHVFTEDFKDNSLPHIIFEENQHKQACSISKGKECQSHDFANSSIKSSLSRLIIKESSYEKQLSLSKDKKLPSHDQGYIIENGPIQYTSWVHVWTITSGKLSELREYFNTSITILRPCGLSSTFPKSKLWKSNFTHNKSFPSLILAI